ncbi:DUF2840 domain-containing protein [Caulobacter hibisci]|uniref:DUF2840 domain-containing protein n=1 Tax=Caulobacter hibisci TaxID=2035993 RepID=A0ABS0SZY7_9CAUL|nr:DUF2840 domain-containing protein [Caulobacter hibisci]MBI1685178.1 DUF2840 domain-containing protein [Caulobacter hibisci]
MSGPTVGVEIDLTWWEGRIEQWIRFGAAIGETRLDRRRRTLAFAPGSVLCLVRWAAGPYGTIRSELDILRAPAAGEAYTTRPCVRPGAECLALVRGWPKVQQALAAIDRIEAAGGAPVETAPDYWRHLHNRLAAGLAPRDYGAQRHHAFVLRKALDRGIEP